MVLLDAVRDGAKITDWIIAIAAAIGVPLSLFAFIKLVLRDRLRESQIASLGDISNQLTNQVQELSAQTQQFKYQSDMMFEHNKLFERQLVLLHKGQQDNSELQSQQIELTKQARRAEIRPCFTHESISRLGAVSHINIALVNQGDVAIEVECFLKQPTRGWLAKPTETVQRHGGLNISINDTLANSKVEVELKYQDADGNSYKQVFVADNPNPASISRPELLTFT